MSVILVSGSPPESLRLISSYAGVHCHVSDFNKTLNVQLRKPKKCTIMKAKKKQMLKE